MKKIIEITNGPSREELFDGLRLFAEKRLIPFRFKVNEISEKQKMVAVIIDSIQAEDDGSNECCPSGHSWNITFYVNKLFVSDEIFVDKPAKIERGVIAKKVNFDGFRQLVAEKYPMPDFKKDLIVVKASYSTKTRKGNITIE